MNNLHRELAPISDAAWAQIEEEVARTFKRHLAGRRAIDVRGPEGTAFSAVGTGHLQEITTPGDGIQARQRQAMALVEFRVPFELERQQIDDVERGANDSDWQPAKIAARRLAFAEDGAIFVGYRAAGIIGKGYPVLEHVKRLVKDKIIWAPAVPGAVVLTTRGGDFELHLGQDTSIGYLSHTDTAVRLYLQETFTFLLLTTEAAVALAPPEAQKG